MSNQPARVEAEWEDSKRLGAFWTRLSASLDSAYAEHPESREARIEARDSVYVRARQALVGELGPALSTVSPFYVQRVALDNASLLARRVYARDLDLFDLVYVREGRSLRRAIGRIVWLAKSNPDDPYAAVKSWLCGGGC